MRRANSNEFKMVDVHDVRNINQTVFLHLIREKQPISRAEIARATGLRAGTVSSIVNRLIREKLVYEGTEGPSNGGRPPKYLYVNAESAYVLAIDIGVKNSVFAIGDFNGRILTQRSILTEGEPTQFFDKLAHAIQELIQNQYPRAKFEAVGVSVPGLVDRDAGTLIVSPNLDWNNVPVRELLERHLDLPVYVENDANAAAFSELWYGPLSEVSIRTLLFVLVVEGLGTGLIINGELHVGSDIGLGGFGHMTIDPHGDVCTCGRRGCWETFASNNATVKRYHAGHEKSETSVQNMADIIALAHRNDSAALKSLQITAEYLVEGITNLAHGLSPEAIVIGGDITAAWSLIEPVIKEKVKSRYLISSTGKLNIRPASVQRPSLFGIIPIALQYCHKNTNSSARIKRINRARVLAS